MRGASRRAIAAIFGPGTVLPGPDRGHPPALIPQAFARVHPVRVQPSKADPHSWVGRFPKASRVRGLLTTPAGAAPGPHDTEQPVRVPSWDQAMLGIISYRNIVNKRLT